MNTKKSEPLTNEKRKFRDLIIMKNVSVGFDYNLMLLEKIIMW